MENGYLSNHVLAVVVVIAGSCLQLIRPPHLDIVKRAHLGWKRRKTDVRTVSLLNCAANDTDGGRSMTTSCCLQERIDFRSKCSCCCGISTQIQTQCTQEVQRGCIEIPEKSCPDSDRGDLLTPQKKERSLY